ncbi:hypothetical protein pipiens_013536 [Culex pipiens pipiens]|uniref:Uncharacterized protein n=1 Tax=Culex pipiens pipiens TaxID=38569 RepID=A0ABD1CY27_CULPP
MFQTQHFAFIVILLVQIIPTWCQQFYGISLAGQQQIGRKKLLIHHIGQCSDHKDLPIFVPDMRIAALNSTTSAVSGTVHFREDFPTGWDVVVSIRKCDNFRPDADCRPFMDHLVSMNQCTMSRLFGDVAYMKYLKNLQPRAECPFRKGNYTFGETAVDDELVRQNSVTKLLTMNTNMTTTGKISFTTVPTTHAITYQNAMAETKKIIQQNRSSRVWKCRIASFPRVALIVV